MTQRALFILQILLVAGLFAFHFLLALPNEWYWHYVWLDVPMHFLGGLWAALAMTWVLRAIYGRARFVPVFAGVIAIGIAWEFFEYAKGLDPQENFAFDTSLDILMDLFGGICGFFAGRMFARDTMTPHGGSEEVSDRAS